MLLGVVSQLKPSSQLPKASNLSKIISFIPILSPVRANQPLCPINDLLDMKISMKSHLRLLRQNVLVVVGYVPDGHTAGQGTNHTWGHNLSGFSISDAHHSGQHD